MHINSTDIAFYVSVTTLTLHYITLGGNDALFCFNDAAAGGFDFRRPLFAVWQTHIALHERQHSHYITLHYSLIALS